MNRFSISRSAVWASLIVILCFNIFWRTWVPENNIIASDVRCYYSYLTLGFIYNDLKGEKVDQLPLNLQDKIFLEPAGNDKVIKTSYGVSLFYLPFFALASLSTYVTDYPLDGYSLPFRMAILVSGIFFFTLGLFTLRKILLNYFNEAITAAVLIVIAIGTNVFRYVSFEPGMSHAFSFFLVASFLNQTIVYYRTPSLLQAGKLGVLLGLISLVRPTNVIIAIVFALYNVTSVESFNERFRFLLRNFSHLCFISVLILVFWIPQFLYWKYVTGQFFYFSYGDERFYFSNPHIIEGLFSYRKGWLLYTPVMTFALLGILYMKKKAPSFFYSLLLFLPLNIYIIFSWWCWWYGGGFGQRPMIDSYPLLAIPLACLFSFVFQKSLLPRFSLGIVMVAAICLNIFQNVQMHYETIHWDAMSKEAYWDSFGRLKPSTRYWYLLEPIDVERARRGEF